jgi:hypothetical protein
MYRHIVLFSLHEGADADEAMRRLRELGEQADAIEWRTELSVDQRKGRVIVENALFADEAEFQTFRASAAHQAVVAHMKENADWVVGDYPE